MHEVDNEYGYGIEITHRDEHYPHTIIYFDNTPMQKEYFKSFSVYQGSSLHDNYDIFEVIGTGQFSIVYRCVEKKSGRCYALKDIALDKLKSEAVAILNNESELMRIINYPQIVKHQETIRSKTHIYIIAEYIPGKDLFEYVSSKKRLSEYDCAFIIGEIISAVSYLHSLEIVHRDLKPENIMVIIKNK